MIKPDSPPEDLRLPHAVIDEYRQAHYFSRAEDAALWFNLRAEEISETGFEQFDRIMTRWMWEAGEWRMMGKMNREANK